jgi:DNA-binding GntR family transcriptional regulator
MKPAPAAQPRADHAFLSLRKQIINGEIQPGALLAESAVAQGLGISRVPVREALFNLEREGLVEFSGSGRAYVKGLSAADFEELFTLRLTLEPLAAKIAATAFKAEVKALARNIRATRKAQTIGDVTRLDLDFHELILEASHHSRLLKLWRALRSELELWLGQLLGHHQDHRLDTRESAAAAHEEIVKCFHSKTPAACERLMRKNIQRWRDWLPTEPAEE